MARIYQTRQLLSPEAIGLVQNRADYNVNFDKAIRDRDSQVYRDYLMTAGKGIDQINDWWAQKKAMEQRQAMAGQWDVGTDPAAVAAKEEYVRTGSPASMITLHNLRESNKMHENVATRDKQIAAQRQLGQLEPLYNAIMQDPDVMKDPNKKAKMEQLYNDINYYRGVVGLKNMPAYVGSEPSTPPGTPEADGTPAAINDDLAKYTEPDKTQILDELLDPKTKWTNENLFRAQQLAASIADPGLNKAYNLKIVKRGDTDEVKAEKRRKEIGWRKNFADSYNEAGDISAPYDEKKFKVVFDNNKPKLVPLEVK